MSHYISGQGAFTCAGIGGRSCENGCCPEGVKKCYVIDDFGYVIIGPQKNTSVRGKHLGALDSDLFASMDKQKNIFNGYKIRDSQAVCNEAQMDSAGEF